MTGGYRCSLGHDTPAPADGSVPSACPVCGDATLRAGDHAVSAAVVIARVPGNPVAGDKDATLAPGPIVPQTVTFAPTPLPPRPPDTPSFSSLVGMPGEKLSPTRLDNGSLVPFGGETADFTPPAAVPGYEILQEVGRGGMGVVYKARQVSLNRIVALKMILAGIHAGPSERERFRREAEAVATLQNHHIVQIFEIGEAGGHLYLALEYVDGGSLAQHLAKNKWSPHDAAAFIELLARAVHYAHLKGVVHRDLKPGNVLLSEVKSPAAGVSADSGTRLAAAFGSLPLPKITDFGLAKRLGDNAHGDGTKTGAVMGTPSYIAPEQASGKTREVGPVADVYALGAILYELLTGRPPFMGETPLDTVLQVLNDDPVPPKRLAPAIPRDLETICLKCLTKSPAQRYHTADELAADLHRYLVGEPIKARPLSTWGRAVKWANRHPALAGLGAVALAATLGLVVVLSVAYAEVRDAVSQKEYEAQLARDAKTREEEARRRAELLAGENEKRRQEAVERSEDLNRQVERTRRAVFALQLAQIAAMCERDPTRARAMLDDEARCPPNLRDFTWAYLRRLCEREERTYAEHGPDDPLHAVAYSPTGAFVATAGDSGRVRLWDPRTGRTWAVLVGNTRGVLDVAFSPDGGAIATAGRDGTVRLWALPLDMLDDARRSVNLLAFLDPVVRSVNLEPDVTLAAHPNEATCVAFSPEGEFLVSGGDDGALRRWDLRGWRPGNPHIGLVGGPAAVAAAATHATRSPDARSVWQEREFRGAHPGGVRCMAFAASGDVLVSGGADRAACVWAPDVTRLIRSYDDHADAVLSVAVSASGRLLATTNGQNVRLINLETGRERRLIGHTAAVYSLAMNPEGESLASTGFDRSIRLWDVTDAQERGVLLGHSLAVGGVALSPDRRTVVSASMDSTARVWQTGVRPSEERESFRDQPLTAATTSENGVLFLGGDESGRVRMFRSDLYQARSESSTKPFFLLGVMNSRLPGGAVRAVAASPDAQSAAAATAEGVFLWRLSRLPGGRFGGSPYAAPQPVPYALRVPRTVYAMTFDASGLWLATLDEDGVRLWDLRPVFAARSTGRPAAPAGPGLILPARYPQDIAFHPDGDRLAVAVGNGVRLIDRKGAVITELPHAHPGETKALAFGRDERGVLLATGDAAGLVKVWRVGAAGELTPEAESDGHTAAVSSLAFSADGRTLASGGYDRTVFLSDPLTGQERAALTGHADRVMRLQFLPDSTALLTVGRDGSTRRWRATGGAITSPPATLSAPPRPRGMIGKN